MVDEVGAAAGSCGEAEGCFEAPEAPDGPEGGGGGGGCRGWPEGGLRCSSCFLFFFLSASISLCNTSAFSYLIEVSRTSYSRACASCPVCWFSSNMRF